MSDRIKPAKTDIRRKRILLLSAKEIESVI